MQSTMQNIPLTIAEILRYAANVHGDRTVTTATGDGFRHATYREVGQEAARLANALRHIGIDGDGRIDSQGYITLTDRAKTSSNPAMPVLRRRAGTPWWSG